MECVDGINLYLRWEVKIVGRLSISRSVARIVCLGMTTTAFSVSTNLACPVPHAYVHGLIGVPHTNTRHGRGAFLGIGARSRLQPRVRTRAKFTMEWKPPGLLREAVEKKEEELAPLLEVLEERPDHPLNLRLGFFATGTSHKLTNALRRSDGTLAVLGMMKRVEFSADLKLRPISALEDIEAKASELRTAGVDALFVHTDTARSMVNTADLALVAKGSRGSSECCGDPRCDENLIAGASTVRSDLIVHPVQIAEAAELGCTAVNIVAAAALADLMELLNAATAMGLEAVVECHEEIERDFAIEAGATILYLTNRNRATDKLVPGQAEKLRDGIPHWVMTIGGGDISTATQCWNLLDAGFNGVMLGKSLLQSRRPKGFIDEIRSQRAITMDPFAGRFDNPFLDESLQL